MIIELNETHKFLIEKSIAIYSICEFINKEMLDIESSIYGIIFKEKSSYCDMSNISYMRGQLSSFLRISEKIKNNDFRFIAGDTFFINNDEYVLKFHLKEKEWTTLT